MDRKNYKIIQKTGEDEYLLIHPETNINNVIVPHSGEEDTTLGYEYEQLRQAIAGKADLAAIPDVSAFITKAVSDLVNYYTKTDIDATVEDLQQKISAVPKFAITVASVLPITDISTTTIYLIKTSETESGNLFTEYIYVNGEWESLGTQTLDLTGYAKENWVSGQIADFLKEADVNALISAALSGYVKTADLASAVVAKSGTADSVDKLSTAREIAITGDASGSATFDGSTNAAIEIALSPTGVGVGVYSAVQVDTKGRVLAGAQVVEVGANGQDTPSSSLAVGGLFFKEV